MPTESTSFQELSDRIRTLPPEKVSKVADFVEFLALRHVEPNHEQSFWCHFPLRMAAPVIGWMVTSRLRTTCPTF